MKILFFLALTVCVRFADAQTKIQQQDLSQVGSDPNHRAGLLPVFFERSTAHGSRFLSNYWLEGVLELANHRKIPAPGDYLYFNYDKVNSRLEITRDGDSTWSYPVDSISSFTLADSNTFYTFERIPWISRTLFLQPVLKSANGYSLYKQLLTKFTPANYRNEGYYTTGRNYDQYTDFYEYYIIYPGNKSYRKFFLHKDAVRKALKKASPSLDAFFPPHGTTLNEEGLVDIIRSINVSIPSIKVPG